MADIRPSKDVQLYELSLSVHNKDHEPDWTDPEWGVCRMCGLGRVREVSSAPENSS